MPLSRARPSFAPSSTGCRPARASASTAGRRSSPTKASPTPIITLARCESGARSPEAPTEPCAGTTGSTPFTSMASSSSSVSSRTPEAPWARLTSFNAIISRTTFAGIGSPTPAACESTMFRCRVARSSRSMRTLASLPKPVLMPYTGAPLATISATVCALRSTAAAEAGARRTRAPAKIARHCASVTAPGCRVRVVLMESPDITGIRRIRRASRARAGGSSPCGTPGRQAPGCPTRPGCSPGPPPAGPRGRRGPARAPPRG
ncbi:hypothetical protein D3C72_1387050 [compost metagenome]